MRLAAGTTPPVTLLKTGKVKSNRDSAPGVAVKLRLLALPCVEFFAVTFNIVSCDAMLVPVAQLGPLSTSKSGVTKIADHGIKTIVNTKTKAIVTFLFT
jgi:hypothetical protein